MIKSMICTAHQILLRDQVKAVEEGAGGSTYGVRSESM